SVHPIGDVDVLAFDLHLVRVQPVAARVGAVASAEVETEVMTAADYLAAFQASTVERFILMRAESASGIVFARFGEEDGAVGLVAHPNHLAGARLDLADAGDSEILFVHEGVCSFL